MNKKENKNVIDILKENINSKLTYQDLLIEIKNLYVVFLENNIAIICEEYLENFGEYQKCTLHNFFNGETVSTKIIDKFPKTYLSNFKSFRANNGLRGFSIPVQLFLNNYVKKGMVTAKNIITVYEVINDYIKNNPKFINGMFEENEINIQI